jgi:hypothetical protein
VYKYTVLKEEIYDLNPMRTNLSNSNIETYVRKHAYIVGSVSDTGLSLAANPVLHANIQDARAECVRLAKLNPGKNFIALQLGALERVAYQPNVSI